MVLKEREEFLEGVGEGVMADVVQQGRGEKDADILFFQEERGI